jgi:hypothetical protein
MGNSNFYTVLHRKMIAVCIVWFEWKYLFEKNEISPLVKGMLSFFFPWSCADRKTCFSFLSPHLALANNNLFQALKILPANSLSCKKVERRSCISLEEFICNYFLRDSPVIISGAIDHWPARTKWQDIKYLKKIAGDRTVPVEVNASLYTKHSKTLETGFSIPLT